MQEPATDIAPEAPSIQTVPDFKIKVENLGKRFNREWIFKGVNYTFEAGNTYAITGPNGSGKSTLLSVLWGQSPPSSGSVKYFKTGQLIAEEKMFEHLSIATPYMDIIDEFSLEEQLRFHFKLKKPRNSLSLEAMLDLLYLKNARDKFIANFSSGMRQRLKLGLAFFTQADIIFLDEPGTNLDHEAFAWYKNQLGHLPKDSLVFIASNQTAEYPENARKINILDYK